VGRAFREAMAGWLNTSDWVPMCKVGEMTQKYLEIILAFFATGS
jgi:hypothetical protein